MLVQVSNDKPAEKKELSCDSCGWVIKGDEVHAETAAGEVLCEHCLDNGRAPKELH